MGVPAPLARYTVFDFTIARAGATAVRLRADRRATVIGVEPPLATSEGNALGRSDEQNRHRSGIRPIAGSAPAHDLPGERVCRCLASVDHREGCTAFNERRQPRFTDR
jgi:hypothetical protein